MTNSDIVFALIFVALVLGAGFLFVNPRLLPIYDNFHAAEGTSAPFLPPD